MWWAKLIRDLNKPHCEGALFLIMDGECVGQWSVYTDSSGPADPQIYGGPTPPIEWILTERIQHHPNRPQRFAHARIIPANLEQAKADYPNRTFEGPDFFMTHYVSGKKGSSTGCFGPHTMNDWHEYVLGVNLAFDEGGPFSVFVEERPT